MSECNCQGCRPCRMRAVRRLASEQATRMSDLELDAALAAAVANDIEAVELRLSRVPERVEVEQPRLRGVAKRSEGSKLSKSAAGKRGRQASPWSGGSDGEW